MRSLSPLVLSTILLTCACGGIVSDLPGDPTTPEAPANDTPSSPGSEQSPAPSASPCSLTAATTETSTVDEKGCAVLTRDTSACKGERVAAGLSGPWLSISCRVKLTVENERVVATTDGLPDYTSFYFDEESACYEEYATGKKNPNRIATESLAIPFPLAPSGAGTTMHGAAIVGIAVNGVPIYGNFAAPGDDIFNEALTFDRCAGHPQKRGMYHYHAEPTAISQDDANLVGVMRDGYAVYGRKDADGSYPQLDDDGGHTGVTPASPRAPVYHYHVNEQTSTGARTAGQKQWFITNGRFHAAPASCSRC